MVVDEQARRWLRPWLQRLARTADAAGVRPNQLTLAGLLLGVGGAVAAGFGLWLLAFALWLVSRLPDGLDGVLARLQGSADDAGGLADIVADFTAYGAFVVGVAIGAPEVRVACLVLLLAYYVNGTAFLAISGLAEKRARSVVDGERSLQFVTGLTEGFETIVAHGLFALSAAFLPAALPWLVWVFAGMVWITVAQRVRFGRRVLSD